MKQASIALRRFAELDEAYLQIEIPEQEEGSLPSDEVDYPSWLKWNTSVLNLVQRTFGEHSPHFINFSKAVSEYCHDSNSLRVARAVFDAAKEDFEGGYIFNLKSSISGEVVGDFVALAKLALSDGNKDVAAVLSSAALEDALKRFAFQNALDVQDKDMQQVVNALKGKGLVGGTQKSLLDTMPKIRDYAMHVNWDKIRAEDVSSVVGFMEQFLP
jgi:hypothetical protein